MKLPYQQTLPIFDYSDVVDHFANGDSKSRGAVFTRREVVDFVLDLAAYTIERLLAAYAARTTDRSRIAVTGSVSNHVSPLVTPDLQESCHAFPITTLPG